MIDIQNTQKKLRWLKRANVFAWLLTVGLFFFPLYQWYLGKVLIDLNFLILTFANIIILVVSIKIAALVKFTSYQIRYFSDQGINQNE